MFYFDQHPSQILMIVFPEKCNKFFRIRLGLKSAPGNPSLHYYSSTTKKIISPLPQCLWPPIFAVFWLTMKGFCRNMWQTNTIVYPLPQRLWPANFTEWWFTIRSSHPESLWSRGLARSGDKVSYHKQAISTTTMVITTKLRLVLTYREEILLLKSHDRIIMCCY